MAVQFTIFVENNSIMDLMNLIPSLISGVSGNAAYTKIRSYIPPYNLLLTGCNNHGKRVLNIYFYL
jgi:hypothetical protein